MDPEREQALAGFGLNLGMCFQMVDDLLDFTAEEKTLGKPVAHDLREGKVTLPMIFLLRRAGKAGAEKVKAVLDDRGFSRVTREELVRLARDCGALDEARELAERYAAAARRDLLAFRAFGLPRRAAGAARLPARARPLSGRAEASPMTTRSQAEQRIGPLRELLRRHERLYYVLADPGDQRPEYDALERELRSLEAEFPDLVTPDSPSQRVGETPSAEFPSFVHRVPMLSLDNTYSEDELREFEERIFRWSSAGARSSTPRS